MLRTKSNTAPVPNVGIGFRPSYPELLDQAWQQHIAPREAGAPTVISTFAGCGGSSLGYSMAGYRELLAVEWDQNAVDTFRLNFPDVPVWHGDIANLSVEECLERAGVRPGELDVLDGSPPCQGFSTTGKKDFDDPRNQLFKEYSRLIKGLQPRCFVMENVSGMVKGKMKLIFADILRELKACGYLVSARLMNTMNFNVPQTRQRIIFIGVREDVGVAPTHPLGSARVLSTVDAFRGLNNQTFGPEIKGLTLERLKQCKPGKSLADVLGRRSSFSFQRLDFNRPCFTVPKSGSLSGYCYLFHPVENRGLTLEELKRVHSYPDGFQFTDYKNGMARIGNSVPPLFMRAIARHIREHILNG
jgi:DNA (cytosine-5)-methyltransferase 1